nr:hypothetical protein [Cellulomonas chengniuliangii]
MVPAFSRSSDFAIDKPAGRPCPNLQRDCRCGIHSELDQRGFHGCTVFDCFGAGQKVVQTVFAGRDWHEDPAVAQQMFAVLPVVRQLHELLWHLAEALALDLPAGLRAELAAAGERIDALTRQAPVALAAVEPGDEFQRANPLLQRASEHVRARVRPRGADRRGAQLMGANLRGAICAARACAAPGSSGPTCARPTCDWPTCDWPTSRERTSGAPTCAGST